MVKKSSQLNYNRTICTCKVIPPIIKLIFGLSAWDCCVLSVWGADKGDSKTRFDVNNPSENNKTRLDCCSHVGEDI